MSDKEICTTISLITFTDDIYCIGPRRLSSQLKRHGFRVNLIFLRPTDFWGQARQRFQSEYYNGDLPESVYQQLLDVCRDSAVIGLSVWTHQVDQVSLVSNRLRNELNAVVVWGGIHPTSYPEDAVRCVDGICIGEGDVSFLRLAQAVARGGDYRKTRGFWFQDGDRVIRNPGEPLVDDLNEIPFMDFEFQDHFVNDQDAIKRMDMRLMKKYYGAKLWTMFSQGCPYKCTFCSNDVLIDLDSGYRKFRQHSAEFFLAEIDYILSKYPHIHNIVIDDDAFMFLPLPVIQEFARKYKEQFTIPLFVTGIIPASIEERKFQAMIDAGMVKARIGVQSDNKRIMKEVFVRPRHSEKVLLGSEIANRNRKKMAPVQYDLIVDNPWEHPEELKDTLRLVSSLKPPYTFAINSLTLLPGTTIYSMGEKAGFTDKSQKITLASYVTYMSTELNLTLAFYNFAPVPKFWLKRILNKNYGARTITMKQYPRMGAIVGALGLAKKIVVGLLKRDISALPRPFDLYAAKTLGIGAGPQKRRASVIVDFEHCKPNASVLPRSTAPPELADISALRVVSWPQTL